MKTLVVEKGLLSCLTVNNNNGELAKVNVWGSNLSTGCFVGSSIHFAILIVVATCDDDDVDENMRQRGN